MEPVFINIPVAFGNCVPPNQVFRACADQFVKHNRPAFNMAASGK
jgi:hypothetical protein